MRIMDGETPKTTCKNLCQKAEILFLTVELKISHLAVNVPHLSVPDHTEDAGRPLLHYAAITWPK